MRRSTNHEVANRLRRPVDAPFHLLGDLENATSKTQDSPGLANKAKRTLLPMHRKMNTVQEPVGYAKMWGDIRIRKSTKLRYIFQAF